MSEAAHFGAALRLLRVDAGLSLRALAERIGVSGAYLSRVENGHDAVPTPDRLVKIADTLGLPPSLLIDLASKVGPFVSHYLAEVPAASALFLEIVQRHLGPAQLARIKTFMDREFGQAPAGGRTAPRLGELLSPERVVLGLSCSALEDALDIAAMRLAGHGLGAAEIASELRRREAQAPTLLGRGIAVPHAVLAGAPSRPQLAIVTLAQPLAAPSPDDLPLRLLVVLVAAPGEAEGARGGPLLQLLARIVRLAQAPEFPALSEARRERALIDRLRAMEDLYG